MHVYFVHREVDTLNRSSVTWVHPGEGICQFNFTASEVLDSHVVLLYAYVPTWVGQRMYVRCRWTQAIYGPYALPRAVHRRIGGIAQLQTRCPAIRVQCWSSDFLFQSATYLRMRWGHRLAAVQLRVLSAKHQPG